MTPCLMLRSACVPSVARGHEAAVLVQAKDATTGEIAKVSTHRIAPALARCWREKEHTKLKFIPTTRDNESLAARHTKSCQKPDAGQVQRAIVMQLPAVRQQSPRWHSLRQSIDPKVHRKSIIISAPGQIRGEGQATQTADAAKGLPAIDLRRVARRPLRLTIDAASGSRQLVSP